MCIYASIVSDFDPYRPPEFNPFRTPGIEPVEECLFSQGGRFAARGRFLEGLRVRSVRHPMIGRVVFWLALVVAVSLMAAGLIHGLEWN